jgi:glutamyl-tRNA reductase
MAVLALVGCGDNSSSGSKAYCKLVPTIQHNPIATMKTDASPDDVRKAMTSFLASMDQAVKVVPEAQRENARAVRAAYDLVTQELERVGYDLRKVDVSAVTTPFTTTSVAAARKALESYDAKQCGVSSSATSSP